MNGSTVVYGDIPISFGEPMRRREFFWAAASAGLLDAGASAAARSQGALTPGEPRPGDYAYVVARARELSTSSYDYASVEATGPFADLGYDSYRAIRPRTIPIGPDRHGFAIDLLPPGFLYKDPVRVSFVSAEGTREIPFSLDLFDFPPEYFPAEVLSEWVPPPGLGFSGFRVRHSFNRPDFLEEFAVFQGASYFRAVGRNLIYGLSARGLALRTGDRRGEEFPVFRHFWIEQPAHGARSISVRALLDSESCSGAFEFEIIPGETTTMHTRCTLFPRVTLEEVGVAPLTSMYVFGPQWRANADDFRSAVHDSEGLQMVTGDAERLWRPLTNPRELQISAFRDSDPKAFGLAQRQRDFASYQDDQALYEKRPTGWVEPSGGWGSGSVMLVEIPTEYEFHDNVVTFWRPDQPLEPAEDGHSFDYWLHWCAAPPDSAPLARIHVTRAGRSIHDKNRRVLAVDFVSERRWDVPLKAELSASAGEVPGLAIRELPSGNITRVTFEFSPAKAEVIEFQLSLAGPEGPLSERWLYRWTPA